jgi:hypothetical protein
MTEDETARECMLCGGPAEFLVGGPLDHGYGLCNVHHLEHENDHGLGSWSKLLKRSDIGGNWMFTFGWERMGLRITRGRLFSNGKYHRNVPDVFILWKDRRIW